MNILECPNFKAEKSGIYQIELLGSKWWWFRILWGGTGCDAILETSTEDNIIHTGGSNHYSGIFSDMVMVMSRLNF